MGDEFWFYSATIPSGGFGVGGITLGGITVHLDMNPVVGALTISSGSKVVVEPNFALGLERRAGGSEGDLSNDGTLDVSGGMNPSRLSFITDDSSVRQRISGHGAIRLGSSSLSFLEGYQLEHASSHTIEGSGNVHVMQLTNDGLMRAGTALGTLAIGLPGGISNSVLINRGVVEAAGGGTVHIRNGSVGNAGGVINAKQDSIVRILVFRWWAVRCPPVARASSRWPADRSPMPPCRARCG